MDSQLTEVSFGLTVNLLMVAAGEELQGPGGGRLPLQLRPWAGKFTPIHYSLLVKNKNRFWYVCNLSDGEPQK